MPLGEYKPDALPSSVHVRQSVLAYRMLASCGRDRFGDCESCGRANPTRGRVRMRAFDVHHIDKDRDNYSPYNLLIVCRSCHRYADNEPYICRLLAVAHSILAAYAAMEAP